MLAIPKVRAVFVKEWRESLRDRRTIFASIVVPVLLWPVVMLLMSEATQVAQTRMAREQYQVALEPLEEAPFLQRILEEQLEAQKEGDAKEAKKETPESEKKKPAVSSKIETPKLVFVAVADSEKALKEGLIDAILRVPPGFERSLMSPPEGRIAADETPQVEMLYDEAERRSVLAVRHIKGALDGFRAKLQKDRLEKKGLGEGFIVAFRIKEAVSLAPAEKVGGSRLGGILPVIFILMVITGALNPAIDLTAGEKERSTLETLIAAPVRPLDVITGKFLTVAALALLNAILNIASFALTFYASGVWKMETFKIPWSALPATLLLLLPLTLFFAGLLLAVSSFAANFKEAQVYVLPVYLVPMLGLMVSIIPGIELEGPLLVLPVVNTSLLIKELFLGHEDLLQPYVFVFVSTSLFAAAAVLLAARVFAREEVLFASQGSLRFLLSRRVIRAQPAPGPADALLVVALLFPINFYFSLLLSQLTPQDGSEISLVTAAAMVMLPQVVILFGVPLFASWYLRLNMKNTFMWKLPRPRAMVAGLLLGSASWVLAIQFVAWQNLIWEIPHNPDMERFARLLGKLPMALTLVLFALTPAICEEHVFRGYLLTGLRSGRNKWFAIILVGAIFGAFHLPMFRQPVTFAIGVAIAYLAWESRSLWPGVLFHLLHNGLSVAFGDRVLPEGVTPETALGAAPKPEYAIAAAVIFVIGLMVARGCGRQEEPTTLGAEPVGPPAPPPDSPSGTDPT